MAEIWAYLAEEASDTVATRFVASVEAKFAPLLQSPLIGSPRDKFAVGLRAIFKTPYVIYSLSAIGASLMLANLTRMSPCSSNSQFSLP